MHSSFSTLVEPHFGHVSAMATPSEMSEFQLPETWEKPSGPDSGVKRIVFVPLGNRRERPEGPDAEEGSRGKSSWQETKLRRSCWAFSSNTSSSRSPAAIRILQIPLYMAGAAVRVEAAFRERAAGGHR